MRCGVLQCREVPDAAEVRQGVGMVKMEGVGVTVWPHRGQAGGQPLGLSSQLSTSPLGDISSLTLLGNSIYDGASRSVW